MGDVGVHGLAFAGSAGDELSRLHFLRYHMIRDATLARVFEAPLLLAVRKSVNHVLTIHVGRDGLLAMDQTTHVCYANVHFHPKAPQPALAGVMHLGIALALLVLR